MNYRAVASEVIRIGAICTALVAIVATWHLIGGDTLAWSSDIKRLDKGQAAYAIDSYSKAIRDDTILKEQVKEPATKALIDERINDYQAKLSAARARAIELGK
jgi:hypothetical protein